MKPQEGTLAAVWAQGPQQVAHMEGTQINTVQCMIVRSCLCAMPAEDQAKTWVQHLAYSAPPAPHLPALPLAMLSS